MIFSDVPCIDSTRIIITFFRKELGNGYIHANRVEYPTLRNKYIITQGPLPGTVDAFWKMIWQENVFCIVMLCRTIEDGKRKSAEYFSPIIDALVKYGPLSVVLKDRTWDDNVVTSMLEVEYLHESRMITHHQWREWADFKVGLSREKDFLQPPTDHTLVSLLQKVRGKSTVVVHCSAGVGRSGTFVALEMCLQDLANGIPVNVFQVVVHLRKYRALAVQTFEQYLSIYRAILQVGEKHGAISKSEVERFYNIYQQHVNQ
ncbi:Protein-tyrosine phosphatase [Dictyocaulus viviparus]|uniref:Protein-tyrosine phosphatase n=1 Tax=Dictyocaulus viviparus TaxID=29172 RepID=A0A0D8X9Z3_DICVI|nr:Protein-tyrosine phosphatase [Dictyocaulus viviparus]